MLLPMPKRPRPHAARTPSRRLRSLALRLTLLALLLAVGFAAFSVAAPNDIKADGHAPLWDTDVAVGTYWVQGSAYRGYLRHKKTLDANVGSINSSAHFSHHGTSFQVRTLFTESDGALRFLAQPWMGYGHRQDLFFVIGEGGNTRVFDVNSGRFSRTDSITLVYGSQGIRWRSGQSFRVRIYEKSDTPFVIDQYVSSRPAAGNTYKLGETLEFTVHFSENVDVTGAPRLGIRPVHNGNAVWRDASYARGSGTNKLVFSYPVHVLEYANEGTGIFDSSIRLQGGTIRKVGSTTNAVLSYNTPGPGNGHNIDGGVRPIATAITSDSGPDGTYHLGEIIEATVTFNHPVDVTGRPRLGLRFATGTEGVWKDVLYDRGSGTDKLVFRYTVAAGDTAPDGVGVFYNALKHNGGTVKVSGTQADASLTNQFVASSADHRVYATARVAGVEITSDAGDDRTYHLDEVVEATVTFSHRLDVTGSPRLGLRFVSGDRSVWKEAAYVSGDGSNELVFEYRVSPGDAAGDGVGVYYDGLLKNGVTLRVAGTQVDAETTVPFLAESDDHLVDGFVRITGTAITSDPGPDLTYHLGDTVAVALTFSHNVDVTGTPRLGLRFVSGDRSVWRDASYASGHGGKTLTFEYTVAEGDSATDGVGVYWNGVRPLRGAIKWSGNNVDATLDNTLLRPDPDHRVNGVIPPVTLLLSADTISEKDGVTVITGIVSPPSDTDFIVSVSAIPVSPADAGDFTLSGSALSFDAGSNTSTGTVTLTANDNDVDEADKQVTISGTVSGSAQVASPPDRTVNIIDDEQVLTVALSLTPDTIPEDGGESVVTASLDGRSVADTTVTVSLDPAQPEHYGLDAGTLTIPAGETVSTGTLTIRSIDDPLDNADRAVTVTAAAANDQGVEQPAAQTLTITDDDVPPGAPSVRVWRVGNGSVTLIWTRPGETGTTPLTGYQHRYKAGTADYGAWQDITTDAPGADAADLTTVEVTGLTNETAHVFQVRAVNSAGGGGPSAGLTATPTAAAAPSAPQNLTAAARDSGVTLRWEAPLYHGSSPITFYAYKQRTDGARYPDGYTVVGLATSIDITQLTNGTLYFFEVIAVNHAAGEGATAEASARPAIPSTISITLVETTRQRREGRDVEFTVARGGNEATTNDVVVNLGVTETGDVIKGEPPATVAIPAGDRSVRLTLPTDNDQSDEDDSVITVRLLGGDGYLLGTPDSAEVTVPDDDAPMLTIRYATDVSEVGESAGSITVTLEARTGTPDRPVIKSHTVTLSTWFTGDILNPRPGEAMPGLDYDPLSENVRFLPADFTPEGRYRVAYRTFEIDIYDDEIYEEDQSFQLLLQPAPGLAVNVVLESDPRPLVTIVDDDPPPSVTVSDGGAVAEGEDAEFTIRLSAESERAVTVWYSTTGEGTAGIADYEAAGGTIRFEPRVPRLARDGGSVPGETEKTFTVTTIDDAIAEANEFLTVEVAIPPEGAGAAVLGSPVRGEARILDDDQPLSAPRGLTAFADNGAVTLQWQPPADDGGYGIAHYERRLRREDRSDWTSWFTVPGGSGADSVKIAGLTNGTAVEFELRAVNTAPVAVRGPAASVSATPAGTPPALLSATVNGSRLTLVYGSLLKTDATASNAAFTLYTTTGARQQSGRRRITPVTGISVSGASVNIDLIRPVKAAATVTLDYSSPGSSGIRTVQGVAAADFTGQQVDNATTPTVVTTAISSTPDAKYGYYVEGDTIAVKLTFDAPVAVDLAPVDDAAPSVDISLGGSIQQAVYASGSGSAELAFEYSVVYSDYDADGVSVPAGSVALNGGAIRRDGTGTAAALTHAAVADHADHTVIGRPFISGRAFVSQPHTGGVYHRNELIEAGLTFNEVVDVSGRPRVRILIANSGAYGDLVKAYYLRGSGSDTLVFGYRVRGSDRDNNGAHIYENTLAEGSITRAGTGTRVNWRFSRHAGGWGQRVDGSQDGVPLAPVLTGASGATSAALSWTAPDDSGSAIVSYSYRYAEVGGDWTDWATAAGALDSRTFEVEGLALDTAYTFQVRAHNAVGAGEPSNEATVTTSKAVAALSATVDGDRLLVTYDRPLKSQAVPSANLFSTLTEGDSGPAGTISAVSISGATVVLVLSAPVSPDDTITVTYTLPDPLTATNAIAALNGTPAGPLHEFPVVNVTAPTVQEIAFSTAPQAGDTYAAGEVIGVTVTFNSNVTVDTGAGNPRLSVEIGRAARQLSYTSGGGGAVLTFEYTVSEHDVDRDGIRVLGNSLSTGGGSIRKSGTRINARLGHAAGTAQAGQKVMGPPAVSAVSLTSNPAADETYRRREVIEATVTFTSAVDVDAAGGKPFVAVVVGVDRRSLEYASGTGSDTLVFTYTVTDDDLDTDGISLPENPVATGGGAIRRAGSSDVNAFLDQPGQPGQPGHKVGGYAIIKPARVSDLVATPGKHRVSLDWSAPDDGGSEITGYRIELSTDGAAWTELQANTENAGTSYGEAYLGSTAVRHYRVSAINARGAGPPSEPAVVAPLAATAPDPPTKLAATAVSDTRVDLIWAAPEDDGGARLSGYKVEVFYPNDASPEWILLFDGAGNTGTSYEHSGLVAGTSVRYRVSAINSVGPGLPSDVASAVTVTTPPQPTGLAARADGENVIVLTWDAPQGDLARTITGYKIEASSTGTGGWSELEADTGNRDTTYRHPGLAPGTRNYYRVSAVNPAGNSRASLTADATTNTAAVGQPTITGDAEEGQTLTAGLSGISDHNGRTKADAGDTGYAHSYQWLRVASGSETDIPGAVSSTYTPVNADVGGTLKVRVDFTDDAGNAESLVSPASGVVAPAPTGPDAPTGLAASSAAVETATLAWTGGGDGGSPVLRHQYRFSADGGGTWRQDWTGIPDSAPEGSNAASYTVTTGLENLDGRADTEFTFEVRAVNAVAPGPPSNQSGTTIPLDRAGIISIVRLLTSAELGYQHLIPAGRVATGRPFQVAIVFDRPASGLEPSELIVANGTVNSAGICTPKVWCAEVQPDRSGDGETLTVDVAADSVDAGNDANTADQQFSILIDGSRTSLSITKETTADPVAGAFTVQLEFGEGVLSYITGDLSIVFPRTYHLEAGDIRLSHGELTLARLSNSRYRATVRPPEEFNGELTISVPEDSATTIPGRGNEAADLTVNVNTVDPAQDAFLSSLELSGVTLTPEFDANVSEYTATVAKAVSRTTVTAEANAPGATVTLPGDDAVPGTGPGEIGHQVDLDVGENFLTVTVVSSGGTATRDYYVRVTRQSAANMDSTGNPTISGAPPQVGKMLTASPGDIADLNGLTGATYSYMWYRTDYVDGQPTSFQLNDEATPTYTPVSADVDATLMVRAAFIDDDLHEETRDSAPTAAVAAASANVPGAPTGLTATVGNAQVSLGWTASSVPATDPVTAYHYRYKTDGAYGEWTEIADSASLTEFTVPGLTNGAEHTFQLRAVNSMGSSEPSDEITATPSAITVRVKRIAADRSGPEALYNAPLSRAGRLPFTIRVEFSGAVTGFEQDDLMLTNAEILSWTEVVPGWIWTASVRPDPVDFNGELTARVAQSVADQGNQASRTYTMTIDTTRPMPTIATGARQPVTGTFELTVTFDRPVAFLRGSTAPGAREYAFQAQDLRISHGDTPTNDAYGQFAIGDIEPDHGEGFFSRSATVNIYPQADYEGSVTIAVPQAGLPAGDPLELQANPHPGARDRLGNPSTFYTTTIPVDTLKPSAVIGLVPGSYVASNAAFDVTFTFHEPIEGLELGDVFVRNGAASDLRQTANTENTPFTETIYRATITPTVGFQGDVRVDLAAATVTDLAGNGNTASRYSRAVSAPGTPVVESAAVNGATLTLTYDSALDTQSVPAAGDYRIHTTEFETSYAATLSLTAVSVSGSSVTLTLYTPVRYGDTVTLTYTPGDNPLRTAATETDVPAITVTAPQSIANDTPKATDATLTTLALDVGTLDPEFSPAVMSYDVFVESTAMRVTTVSAAQTDPRAKISISPQDARGGTTGHQVELAADPSVTAITVLVTAEDETETETYTVKVNHGDPTLSVADAGATEGSAVTFTVTLSQASAREVTVQYSTSIESTDTAEAADFTAVPATTLTIPAKKTTKTFTVQTTPDTIDEEQETFTVTLSNPVNGTISESNGAAIGTIREEASKPTPVTATVADKALTLTYDKELDPASTPAVSAFEVAVTKWSGGNPQPRDVSGVEVSGRTVTLTLASAALFGDTVTVTYTVPGTDPVLGLNGIEADPLVAHAVQNDTERATVSITGVFSGSNIENNLVIAPVAAVLVVFDKPVTGFEAGDLTVTNGTATRVRLQSTSPSVQRYSVSIDVTGANSDVLTVSVPEDVVEERNEPSSDFSDTCCQRVAAEIRFSEIETVVSSETEGPVNRWFYVHVVFARNVPDLYDTRGSGETVPTTAFQTTDIEVTNGTHEMPERPEIIEGGKERFRVKVTPEARFEGVLTVSVPAAVAWGDGAVNGASNLFEIEVDTLAPDVTGIEITSDPGEDETYAVGDEIEATVTFREDVTVESGSPLLGLMVGGSVRAAAYSEGSGTDQLVFVYEVVDGDSDEDGVSVEAGRLAGGVVEDAGGNRPPAHGAGGPFAMHAVDGVRPKLSAREVVDARLTLTYDEALDGSSTPAPEAFTVNVGDGVRAVTGVAVSDSVVTLTLASAVSALEAVTVTYTPGADPIQDLVGNDAAALVDETVEVAEPTSPIIFTFDWYTGEPFEVVVAFRKNHIHGSPVTGFDVDDIAVTNGTVMDNLADDNGNGIVWRATVTPTDSTQPVVVSVADGAATVAADDSRTEAGDALTLLSYTNGPVEGMTIMQDSGAYRAEMLFRDTDIITGLDCAEVELSGATKDPIYYRNARYCDFWILPSGGGNITITIAAAAYTNVDGSRSTEFTHTIHATAGAQAVFGSSHRVAFIKTIPASAPQAATPGVAIGLSPSGSVAEGTEITVTMSFANLESDSDTADADYIFRADALDSEDGAADGCEGGGMGNDRYMYKVDENPEVRTGTVSAACPPGDYTVEVSISSPSNVELASATADFTVAAPGQQQQPEPLSTDATLSGLAFSNVDFGAFDSATTGYTASVANDVAETTVTPTTNDDGASYAIKLDGVADADGAIPLAVGGNVITIEITAEDGETTRTYTVTVTRDAPPSTDATLGSLALSDAPFTFAPDTTSYDVNVANEVDQTTVTATANDDGASYVVKLGDAVDEDGTVALSVGSNVITVEVTAEDGKTTKTYTVTVTRAEQPAPGPAVSIELSPSGSVVEGTEITVTMFFANLTFDSDRSTTDYIFRADVIGADQCENQAGGYGLGVERYMYQVDDDPEVRAGTVSDACPVGDYTLRASISSSGNIELASATTDFTVSAPSDQEPPLSADAALSGLTLSGVDIGAFDSATTGYAASVANDVTQTAVTPTVNHAGATYAIKLSGVADADRVIPLAVGSNVITIEVTAEDGNTVKTYTVTVTRAEAPLSTDATLSGLTLRGIDFGTFDPAITGYTAEVANDVAQTTVSPTANDDGATYVIKLDGVADDDGVIPLAVGSNVIAVEVTAEDGETTKTYTATVTRAAPPSTDATLSGLALSGIDFGAFDSATTGYTASVANDVAETTVTPTTNDDGATYAIKLDDAADEDGTVELSVGANVVSVVVTAEDGQSTKTYTVTVTRAEAPAPEPTVAIALSSDSVVEGTEITVTMSFANLTPDNDANLVFRADVVGADGCEGQGIGVARNISKVDEDPEIRTGTISGDCTAGDYTLEVSLTDDDVELASALADFSVVEPDPTDEPAPTSPPGVPDTPTGEVTGKGQVRLDWNDVEGATYYQVRFYGNEDWVELPTDEIEIVIDGSGARVSNLPYYGFYYFSVRAGNAAGVSEWSDFLTLPNPEQ